MAEDTTAPSTDPTDDLVAARAKLDAAEQELHNYKLRLADFENTRKRLIRDAELDRKYAAEGLVRDLLAPLDNLARALDAAKRAGDTGPLATGIAATALQLLDALKRHGVTPIAVEPGTPFDPNLHQAVMQQPDSGFEAGQVVQVVQQGFALHDRVLRAASVIVAG
jgi:molecular chaperone GrpE